MPTPPSSPSLLEPPDVPFSGRSFEDYVRFFALDPARLRGRAVLDVAAGASAFTADACRAGIDAVALDPGYDQPASALAARIRRDHPRWVAQARARSRRFRLQSGAARAAVEAGWRTAAQRFLDHFEGSGRHGRYLRGALPLLPFLDGAFDLVLCAHRLFVPAGPFDLGWHVAACAELVRVSGDEVRIHPACNAAGRLHPAIEPLRRELSARGLDSALISPRPSLSAGAETVLVLRRTPASRRTARAERRDTLNPARAPAATAA